MRKRIQLGLIVLAVSVLVVIAFVRVAPYVRGARSTEFEDSKKRITEVVISAVPPEYDREVLQSGAEDLAREISSATEKALLNLPQDTAPSSRDASDIAAVYRDFVMLNRLGTLEEKIASCRDRGVVPHPSLQRQDVSRSEAMWKYSTSWAKHAPLELDSIRVSVPYLDGKAYSDAQEGGGGINARPLSNGKKLLYDGAGRFTVYEVILSVTMPNPDNKSEFDVDICTSIVNDRLDGSWDVVSLTWSNKPKDAVCVLPYP